MSNEYNNNDAMLTTIDCRDQCNDNWPRENQEVSVGRIISRRPTTNILVNIETMSLHNVFCSGQVSVC